MKKLLVALLATGIQIASADCLETIKKIQDGLGTPAGSSKLGIIDFMRSENDIFERGLNISQDLVQRAAGRPIASSSLGMINDTLDENRKNFFLYTGMLQIISYDLRKLEEQCK